ncbi:MAG: phosphoribosyl-AMP cyclohydrolase [Parasphingorhabdus sp.]|uniref:phosphoribosyl-AMP cyclohydrolase n=1 Tax=Parasphingorhabdus sp. TaxID=2709688 RepID=UPI003299BFE3
MTCDKNDDRETGSTLKPKYDSNGLLSAVVTDDSSGEVLVIAFMDAQALQMSQDTGVAHFYSRSRKKLWKKGETSGNILSIVEMRIDCDQDAVWIKAKPAGPTCHTGATSCFYRVIKNGALEMVE